MESPQKPPVSVQPVELTGKRWKLCILIGVPLMLAGLPALLVGASKLATVLLALGLLATLAGKIGAWWYHR
ncbi:MAG TPA: hypothetical protein PKK06_05130 [Phycisphaerae bacterium]|nr:hypothetical protein [Phycisphaerae bacterium]